jgi:crossover junction endodeoxyribonuclease RusA
VADIDNRVKAALDALTHAGVYDDDSQIDELFVARGDIVKGGRCQVMVMGA